MVYCSFLRKPIGFRHLVAINSSRLRVRGSMLQTLGLAFLSLAILTSATLITPSSAIANDTAFSPDSPLLQSQRNQYKAALKALRNGQRSTFKQHLQALSDYPLSPYLRYEDVRRRLSRLPHDDVEKFLKENNETYLGDQLYRRWLTTLADKKRWHDFQAYYDQYGANTSTIECHYLWARLQTGDRESLTDVEKLWNVGKSQPDECDPLFRAWIADGHLTENILWQRHGKALKNRERALAYYLIKLMSPEQTKLAHLFHEVDRKPSVLTSTRRFREQSPEMHEIILHGLNRLARRDPKTAQTVWQKMDAQHYFPNESRTETLEYLIIQLARSGHLQEAELMMAQSKVVTNEDVVAGLVRDALRNQEWEKVYQYLSMFSTEEQQSERWLYWRARAMEKLDVQDPNFPSPEQIYASLSLTRGFYGFLSADKIGNDYTLVDRPVNPTTDSIQTVSQLPGMRRTLELYTLGSLRDARREWIYVTDDLDAQSLLAAGKIAEEWGWYRKGIEAVADAQHWDDLKIRFPLAFQEQVQNAAKQINVEPPLLFAIARQESAFATDARSPAGAMGLMQLMPATARQTARSIGVKYNYWSLIDPDHNIQLGSTYINQLMEQFDGNRVLAAAAYNAGPNRVKRWIKSSEQQVPYDVWIETIPFKETRKYVQNILSYSVIYGYRLGNQTPMLTDAENQHPLFENL